jgi:DNA-binding NarL/FixJ family response regulator
MSEDGRIRVLLVDDQRLMREGLRTLLELHRDLRVVGEAADGRQAEELSADLQPDVVLMDLRMPRVDGVTATQRIKSRPPGVQILVLTTFDEDELVFRSIDARASGYLLKDVGSDALADAVRAASRGEAPLQHSAARKILGRLRAMPPVPATRCAPTLPGDSLSERELEILGLLGQGAANREIAERLALTEGTVKNYVSAILAKTGPAAVAPDVAPTETVARLTATPLALSGLALSTRGWKTDFSRALIPLAEIQSGGPPHDGIPPFDQPKFTSPAEASAWLKDQEPVVAFDANGDARAYPCQIRVWHGIVDDEVGGVPVAITSCPRCNTAIAFDRRVDARPLRFGMPVGG